MKNNIFKRIEDDFNVIYNELKSLKETKEVKEKIDFYYHTHGKEFLESMIMQTVLDIDSDKSNNTPNPMISVIEKYSQSLIDRHERNNTLNKIIKTWHVWLVAIGSFVAAIGSFGYFILELIKSICDIK